MRQLQAANAGHNTMLDYLKNLEPANIQDLTATTGPEVLEAMNAFIYRLIGAANQPTARLESQPARESGPGGLTRGGGTKQARKMATSSRTQTRAPRRSSWRGCCTGCWWWATRCGPWRCASRWSARWGSRRPPRPSSCRRRTSDEWRQTLGVYPSEP